MRAVLALGIVLAASGCGDEGHATADAAEADAAAPPDVPPPADAELLPDTTDWPDAPPPPDGAPPDADPACGDGLLGGAEECDDANHTAGDGCDSGCAYETVYADLAESEPNDSAAAADAVAGAARVAAERSAGDLDVFAVDLAAGELLVVETRDGAADSCASLAVDTHVRVLGAAAAELAADDDTGPGFCSLVVFAAPAAGSYLVEVGASAADPAAVFTYTLRLTRATPALVGETEPNDSAAAAGALAGPSIVGGAVAALADEDWFSLPAGAGLQLVAEVADGDATTCAGGAQDSLVTIYAPDGATALATDDDDGAGACSRLQVDAATAGTHYVRVARSAGAVFDYRLRVAAIPR